MNDKLICMVKCCIPHGKVWILPLSFRTNLWVLTFSLKREWAWGFFVVVCFFLLLHGVGTEMVRPVLSLVTSSIFLRKKIQNGQWVKIIPCLIICYSSEFARCLSRYSSILRSGVLNCSTDLIWNTFLQLLSWIIRTQPIWL